MRAQWNFYSGEAKSCLIEFETASDRKQIIRCRSPFFHICEIGRVNLVFTSMSFEMRIVTKLHNTP